MDGGVIAMLPFGAEDAADAGVDGAAPEPPADLVARARSRCEAQPPERSGLPAFDRELAAMESALEHLPREARRELGRDLRAARSCVARRRRAIRHDVLEVEGEVLFNEMCGAAPPEPAGDSGRRMFQQGYLIDHGRYPGERIVRCGPPERTASCWRFVCVTREDLGLHVVEFFAGAGGNRWRSLRYVR